MKRRTPMKRTAFRRKSRSTKYARRERNHDFMAFVRTLLCSVEEEWPEVDLRPSPCNGPIEADHMGARGVGQKCPDNETAPLCRQHHRERTDHSGAFKFISRDEERAWRGRAIQRTQTLYAERHGGNLA